MNITKWAMENRTTVVIITVMIILAGVSTYFKLGKLKNPTFTIHTALVITEYPGASPGEVERLVTEPLEKAVQKMGQLDHVRSKSEAGRSTLKVTMKQSEPASAMPQIWNDLRERIGDAQARLPGKASRSRVVDHYGRTYGILFALSGEGFSMRELRKHADYIQKRLKKCENAQGVVIFGVQRQQIVIEISREQMSELPVQLTRIEEAIRSQNFLTDYGYVNAGKRRIRVDPTGNFQKIEDVQNIIVAGGPDGEFIRLGDIATVKREYVSPPKVLFRINGKPALAIGVSTVKHGNTVTLGRNVKKKLKKLESNMPAGLDITFVNFQADNVMKSINAFITALTQAIVIVLVVVLIFLGWRSAFIITNGLIFNICAAFIVMHFVGIDLQVVSLAGLIIVLGMLVDDSVVVTDNTVARLEDGDMSPGQAAISAAQTTGWAQLIATVIAIASFLPMALADSNMGEYCQSLTYVVAIALGASWLQAMVVVPVMGHWLLKKKKTPPKGNSQKGLLQRIYLTILKPALRHPWAATAAVICVFVAACYGFNFIGYKLVSNSVRPQYKINYWLPEGTRIEKTSADLSAIEDELLSWDQVESVATTVGSGPPRFMLAFTPEQPNVAYGSMIVKTKTSKSAKELVNRTQKYLDSHFPQASARASQFVQGGMPNFMIQARISGEDPAVLRRLASRAEEIMVSTEGTEDVQMDWRNQVPVWKMDYSQAAGALREVDRKEMAQTIRWINGGIPLSAYRAGKHLNPILLRTPQKEGHDTQQIASLPMLPWSSNQAIPLGAVVPSSRVVMENAIIHRYNRKRTITVRCNPRPGVNSASLRKTIAQKIQSKVNFPFGYDINWGGSYEVSKKANESVNKTFPLAMTIMLIAVVVLFNGVRQPLIIMISVPLLLVGVSIALLISGKDMGFMPLFGIYALIGIIIRNAVILIREMDSSRQENDEDDQFKGVIKAACDRLRPVLITACCTSFGLVPLLPNVLFSSMAVTIMGGLLVGTLITLVFVPVLYVIFYRIHIPEPSNKPK